MSEQSTTVGSANVRKVVVNRRFGGFGLSDAAHYAYASRKGLTLYPEPLDGCTGIITYWTVPPEARPTELLGKEWEAATEDQRKAANEAYSAAQIYDKDLPRDDPDLVAVVELLGPAANGEFAQLDVAEIPADVEWYIHEYDGSEYVAEKHRTW